MDLNTVKNFLRVDFDDDDELIKLLIDVAEEYITAAVGECDYMSARVKLLAMVIITDLYENREMSTDKVSVKAQYTIRSIINQLQAEDSLKNEA